MSEERERRRRRSSEEEPEKGELLEMGRLFGTISRTEPELWQYVEKEAILTGRKKHEILSDYIARAIIEREVVLKGLTLEQLLAAWDLKDQLEKRLFNKVIAVAVNMFGNLLTQVGELVAGIRAQQEERISQIVEEAKKRDIEYQMKMTQAKMAAALMESMMPMLMSTLSKLYGQQLPVEQQQQQQQQQKQSGVEVEVIE